MSWAAQQSDVDYMVIARPACRDSGCNDNITSDGVDSHAPPLHVWGRTCSYSELHYDMVSTTLWTRCCNYWPTAIALDDLPTIVVQRRRVHADRLRLGNDQI